MTVVLITGGSSGIGLATVRRLAEAGDQVFYASRKPAAVPLAGDVTHVPLDLADPRGVRRRRASRYLTTAGRLDVLVNNAGTAVLAPLEEGGDAEAHQTFEVNVFGPMRLIRAALPVMRAQGGGRIINVTSVNDIALAPFGGWYSASKAALASLSMVLGAELQGSGIFVTVVAPGLFVTGMSEQLPFARVAERLPLRRRRSRSCGPRAPSSWRRPATPTRWRARSPTASPPTSRPPASWSAPTASPWTRPSARPAPRTWRSMLREYVASLA